MAKKGGKYASVIGKLPAMGIDPSRRDAVAKAQDQIKEPPAGDEDTDGAIARHLVEEIRERVHLLVHYKKRQTAGRPWASEYARAYAECRGIRESLIAEFDGAFSLLIEAYQWLMTEQMEVEGTTAITLANGQPVHTYQEPQAKVEDPAAFLAWCMREPDLRSKLTLPWATTNALTKARLLNGEPEPDGVTIWAKTVVRLGSGD